MKFNHFLIIGTVLISITNCKEKPEVKTGEIVSTIASGSQTDEEIKEEQKQIAIDEAKRIEDKKRNVTTLSFNRLEHDFGKVIEDTDNFTEFMVTNTGDKPLIISNVKASCGCTTPEKPEGPIAPGKSDKITSYGLPLILVQVIAMGISATENNQRRCPRRFFMALCRSSDFYLSQSLSSK